MPRTIEEILGVSGIGERSIPGTVAVEGREHWYIEYHGGDFDSEFIKLIQAVQPAIPSHGGAITGGCELTLPDGRKFHAMSYKGDLIGWRKQIELGAKHLGCATARIGDDDLYVSDASAFPLAACHARFY